MVNTITARNNSLNMLSISVSAVLFVTAMISPVHAFITPLTTTHNNKIRGGRCTVANHISIKQPSQLQLPSYTTTHPCTTTTTTTTTTTSLSAHAPLQPGKGGIIVEAKSDFIARDVLIDSMMGRGDGLPPMDGEGSIQQKDEFEDFSSNEDSWLSSSNSMSAAQPANRRSSGMGQQSVGNNNRQTNRPSNKASMSREQMVQQLNSGQQFTQQQNQQQQPPPPPQAPPPPQTSNLPIDQLKISQIQSELTSYSISYDDCFDRTSLEKKLREIRLVMGVASTMDGDSRRNQQQQSGEGEGREEERGFNLDNLQQSTPIQQSPPPIQPPPIAPPQQNSFGSGAGGSSSFSPPQGAFNTGGVSIKGDASILSSSGFVSGDGNVFSTGPPGGGQQQQSPPIQQPPPQSQQPPPQQSNPTSGGPSIEELINQQNKARASKSSRTSPAEQAIFTSSVTNTFTNKKRSPPPPRRQQPPSSNNNSNVRTSISSGYRDNTRPLQPMPKAAGSGSSGSSVGNVSGGGSTSTFTSGGQQTAPPRTPPQKTNKSTTSARNTNPVQQTPSRPTPGNASTGNPFSSNNRRATQGGVGNSFRDSAHGIGFGDVNSYTSTPSSATRGRPTPGNASSGNPSRRSNSARGNTAGQPSGDGVRLGKSRTSYGDFNSGSSIGGDFGSDNSLGSNIGGSSASFRNGNANPPPPRSNTAPQQQVGGPSGRKNSSVSGGGGTSTFSSSSSTPISNFGSSDFGPASSMNAGGVSIKGDSSILSSFGQVGGQQGGSTNVFSSGQEAAPPQAPPPPQNVNVSPPQQQPYDPTPPPMEEPQLDWLTQDSSGGGNSYIPTSPEPPSFTSDYGSASHSDDMYSQQPTATSSYNGKRISELYQEQGLDMFSGNQDGFGAVQGVENAGGDVSYRGSAEDVKVQGKVGDMGATMGGDFGGGSSGGSARYSQGRGYTDMGSDDDVDGSSYQLDTAANANEVEVEGDPNLDVPNDVIITSTSTSYEDRDPDYDPNDKDWRRSLRGAVRRVLPHWLGLDGFHANDNDNNLFIKDSAALRGRQLPHMVTFDGMAYEYDYDDQEKENDNIFIDETMVKEGDQPTGENVLGPHPPLPSPTVVGDEASIPTPTSVVDTSPVYDTYPDRRTAPPTLRVTLKPVVPPSPPPYSPPSFIIDKKVVEEVVDSPYDNTVKSMLVEEDMPVIDRLKPDTTPPSAPLEDTDPEVDESLTYKLKDVIITSVLCEKANDIQTTAQAIEFDEELPYFVKVITCGIGWGWYWNWDETPPTTLKDQEPITWLVSEKSLGTNYGGGNKIIWEAEADDFIWEDEAEDFRLGSIIRSKADGILKVKKHPGEPDIDILIDSDGSLFEDKWPDAGDYDLVAKRIWGEESGDFIVKLIWEAEADDFIIQVGNKVTYSVKYDDIKKKGVIVKK